MMKWQQFVCLVLYGSLFLLIVYDYLIELFSRTDTFDSYGISLMPASSFSSWRIMV